MYIQFALASQTIPAFRKFATAYPALALLWTLHQPRSLYVDKTLPVGPELHEKEPDQIHLEKVILAYDLEGKTGFAEHKNKVILRN